MKNGQSADQERSIPIEWREAINRVLTWDGLAGSDRLRGLLEYLTAETLAGRGDDIRAKTIALDHYGYTAEELVDRESVVRVDAGRLRRKLKDYYREAGASDPVVVSLPKGSYRPQFERRAAVREPDSGAGKARQSSRSTPAIIAIAALLLVGFASLYLVLVPRAGPTGTDDRDAAERAAVFEVSPARLQAINLAESGRDLIFPAVDPERLRAALIVFEAAIAADQSYAGGYAGTAQVLSTIALLQGDADPEALERAKEAAERALSLAPEDGWSQVAVAWIEFVEGPCPEALSRSERAMQLSPLDPHIVEFESLISLFCGEFDRVIEETENILVTLGAKTGFVFTNALGSARFHTGDYAGSIAAFEESIVRGGPTGPISLAYLMAAHHRLGRKNEAERLAQRFEASWPNNRIDLLFARLFANPKYSDDVADAMHGAGWSISN